MESHMLYLQPCRRCAAGAPGGWQWEEGPSGGPMSAGEGDPALRGDTGLLGASPCPAGVLDFLKNKRRVSWELSAPEIRRWEPEGLGSS